MDDMYNLIGKTEGSVSLFFFLFLFFLKINISYFKKYNQIKNISGTNILLCFVMVGLRVTNENLSLPNSWSTQRQSIDQSCAHCCLVKVLPNLKSIGQHSKAVRT